MTIIKNRAPDIYVPTRGYHNLLKSKSLNDYCPGYWLRTNEGNVGYQYHYIRRPVPNTGPAMKD